LSVGDPFDDSDALRRALRDIVAFSVLPALWCQFEPRELAESLAQVLQNTLHLPLVYVRLQMLPTGGVEEIARTQQLCSSIEAAELGRLLADVLEQDSTDPPLSLQNPAGSGTMRCVRVPIAWRGGQWTLVAAGSEQNFPTVEERLILATAANHAAVALERARIFRSLRESELRADSANREKDEFLANVSHEIRTPMNAIIGLTDLVLDSPLSLQQREWLGAVKSAGDHLLGIIESLLDFSKMDANKIELEIAEFSLRTQVTAMFRELAPRANKKTIELAIDIDDDVPDRLLGDVGRFRQVLINLLDNAIKFTARGEVLLLVSVGAADPTSEELELRFVVRDTGIGIPLHQHRLIFEAFAQADSSTTRRHGGTGLGLTIAAKLAALMHGDISVSSEAGRGSTFTLRARFRSHTDESSLPGSVPQWPGVRVLVVIHEGHRRDILKRWLEGWQLSADFVHDGLSATTALMRSASSGPYRFALIDGSAPGFQESTGGTPQPAVGDLSAVRLLHLPTHGRGDDTGPEGAEVRIQKPLIKEDLCRAFQRFSDSPGRTPRTDIVARNELRSANALSLRVLVCEDNDLNAMLVEELLRRRGHHAHVVMNGTAVLAGLEAQDYDVLLLDLHMPGLDGFDVIREIRARERIRGGHLPVIALTARSRDQDRERCLAAGMDGFLTKPINNADFSAAISRIFPQAVWPESNSSK
jgi:two-component system sensor histidine kinase/response regulator